MLKMADGSKIGVIGPIHQTFVYGDGPVFTREIYPQAERCEIDGRPVSPIAFKLALRRKSKT